MAILDLYEIILLFSTNDIFGKFVTSYDKNVLTAFQIFFVSCHESYLLNEVFHNISYSLLSLMQYRNCFVPYTVLNFHLFIFCIYFFKIGSFHNCFNSCFYNLGNIVSPKLFSFYSRMHLQFILKVFVLNAYVLLSVGLVFSFRLSLFINNTSKVFAVSVNKPLFVQNFGKSVL